MPRRLLILIGLALTLPAPAVAADATIVSREIPLAGQRSLAATSPPARFNLVGLHWRGPGSVQFRTRSLGRPLERLAGCRSGGRGPAGQRFRRARRSGAWRLGNPWWVGPSNRIEYRLRGTVTRLRAFFVWSPDAGVPARTLQAAGASGDRAAHRLAGGRVDQARHAPSFAPALRLRARPPHGRRERLHRGAGAGDREGDPALPREGERLERHRLQLPRRPVRHRLRGPLRRDRAQRRRRARRGIQHRLGRRGRARHVRLARRRSRRARRARAPARVAARRRPRRSAPRRSPSSRAGTHASRPGCRSSSAPSPGTATRASPTAPGTRSTACSRRSQAERRRDRAAEAVRADRHRPRAGHGPASGTALCAAPVDGRVYAGDGSIVASGVGCRSGRRLELGRERDAAGRLLVRDPFSRCHLRHGRARRWRGRAGDRRARRRPGVGLAERRRRRRRDQHQLHAQPAGERVRARCRRCSGDQVATFGRRRGSAPASTRSRFDPASLPDGLFKVELRADRHRRPAGDRVDAALRQPDARPGHRDPGGLLAQRRRSRRPDRVPLRARRAGGRARCASSATASGWRRCSRAPLEAGPRTVDWDGAKRVGRLLDGDYEAIVDATDAGDDVDRRGPVRGRQDAAEGEDPAAVPAPAVAERAGAGDAALRHAQRRAGCDRGRRRCASGRCRARESSASSPGTLRATRASRSPSGSPYTRRVQPPARPTVQSGRTLRPDAPLVYERLSDPILVKRAKDGDRARPDGALRAARTARRATRRPPAARPARTPATPRRTRSRSSASSCRSSGASRRSRRGCTGSTVNACRDVAQRQLARRCEPLEEDRREARDGDPARAAEAAELRAELGACLAQISPRAGHAWSC